MTGITKVHGSTTAGSFYGGYQPLFLLVSGTNVGTADTVSSAGLITAEGNFSKAVRAIQQLASIVIIGTRSDNGFLVAVDGATASNNNEADVATRVDTVVTAATGVATTVTVKTLALSEFA